MQELGFVVWDLGFGVWGVRFRVFKGSGFGVEALGVKVFVIYMLLTI